MKIKKWKWLIAVAAVILMTAIPVYASDSLKDILGALSSAAGSTADTGKAAEEDGTYNLLIVGSDRRDGSWNGNSDSIILVTINHNVNKIFMVSFMRDLQADIPGYGVHKINYSYAGGGAQKLIDTLTSNFGVRIDNYVAVDWEAMVDIVDAFGGVDLEIYDYEVNATNGMIDYYCGLHGLSSYEHYVSTGWQHLDGIAALNYSRVRFVGNNDYERTERQRKVLTNLLENLDISDTDALLKLAQALLTEVDHDLTLSDLLTLTGEAAEIQNFELVTDRIPYDGLYSSNNGMLVPVQPDTNERLQAEIYEK